MEIQIGEKVIDAFGEFITEVTEKNHIDLVGEKGKAIYTAICANLIEYYADGNEDIMDESMPNWRDYDEVPQEIIVSQI